MGEPPISELETVSNALSSTKLTPMQVYWPKAPVAMLCQLKQRSLGTASTLTVDTGLRRLSVGLLAAHGDLIVASEDWYVECFVREAERGEAQA